jgi:predicted nucleic acid-binding protein
MKNTVDTLIDAGPLYAVLNRNDGDHQECSQIIQSLDCRFYTTLAVITEAMYLLLTRVGWVAQEALWRMILRGDLILEQPSPSELVRMSEMMSKYSDLPMDFADASLVALAERLSVNRIFTVDRRDFSTYRLHDKKPFTVIGPA